MKIHLLSGFLGSGKTTVIRTAAGLLKNSGIAAGVITNDQGIRLVDGEFMKGEGIPSRQVMNGCFCCNYSELDLQIKSLTKSDQPEVIFAESVGSCTDLVATVFKPLIAFNDAVPVTLSVVCDALLLKLLLVEKQMLFEREVDYIFRKQIEEASLVLLNKTDLLHPDETAAVSAALQSAFGKKEVLPLQAKSPASVLNWMTRLDGPDLQPVALPELDYDLYAAGEARMGWLDSDLLVETDSPDAGIAAGKLIEALNDAVRAEGHAVGHIKWLIDDKEKLSFTAINDSVSFPLLTGTTQVRLLLNARVQTNPERLSAVLQDCIQNISTETGARFTIGTHAAFKPGYPRPQHRMP